MGLFSGIKKMGGRIIDLRADKWMSLGIIKDSFERTSSILADMVIPQKAHRKETFEEALLRLNITEADLTERRKEFGRLVAIYGSIGLIIVLYGIYMGINKHFAAALISTCLSLYAFGQAFRFHFWLFQINHRKLGCTVKEWLNSRVSGESLPPDNPTKKINPHNK